jgi:hypothetical protein
LWGRRERERDTKLIQEREKRDCVNYDGAKEIVIAKIERELTI